MRYKLWCNSIWDVNCDMISCKKYVFWSMIYFDAVWIVLFEHHSDLMWVVMSVYSKRWKWCETRYTVMLMDVMICQVYFVKLWPSLIWSEFWCLWLPNVFYNNGDEGNNGDDPWQCNVTYRILDLVGENVAHTQKILRILRMHIARNIWHTCSQSAQNIWFVHTKYDISCTQNTPHLKRGRGKKQNTQSGEKTRLFLQLWCP